MPEAILAITRVEWSDGKDLPGGDTPVAPQTTINACSQSVTCRCLTDGRPLPLVREYKGHVLGGGGVPECCEELRYLMNPEKNDQQLVLMYRKWRDQQRS